MKPPWKTVFNQALWQKLFSGPLKVRIVIEKPDGTELYHFYPLRDNTVVNGQTCWCCCYAWPTSSGRAG